MADLSENFSVSSVSCMLNQSLLKGNISATLICSAQRSETEQISVAGDRSIVPGDSKPVTERDRRRSFSNSPNSRWNRSPHWGPSSHEQDWDILMNSPHTNIVGIDVAKQTLEICLDEHQKPYTIKYTPEDLQKLLSQMPPAGQCLTVVEATGGYQERLVRFLIEHQHMVSVVNPKRVRELARGLGYEAKTDRIDAQLLVRFGKLAQPRLVALTSEKQEQIQLLSLRRRQLIEMQTAEKNRRDTAQADIIKTSIAQLLDTLQQQIKAIDQQLETLIDSDDYWKEVSQLLTSIPGIAKGTAHMLLAELPELGQLSRQQIAALVGVAPYNKDSGKHSGKRSIRGGREHVRSSLYMAAHNARLWCPKFKTHYQKLLQAGKPHKVALTAIMRKLLVVMNTMVKNNTPWDPKYA